MLAKMFHGASPIAPTVPAVISLPDEPEEMRAAETELKRLEAEKQDAENYFQLLSANYDRIGLVAADGTPIPTNNPAALARAFNAKDVLEKATEAARRRLVDYRRSYEQAASEAIAADCDAIRTIILDKLDEIDSMVVLVSDVSMKAAARRITLKFRSSLGDTPASIARNVQQLRAQLRKQP